MSIPKEPRQQMINMMYLVLTALLALNVSAQVLEAFMRVNAGIKSTNAVIDSKNDAYLAAFEGKQSEDKFGLYQIAVEVSEMSDEYSAEIDAIISELIEESGGWLGEEWHSDLSGMKDTDTPTRIMVDNGKGDELQETINQWKENFLVKLDEADEAMGRDQVGMLRTQVEGGLTLIAEDPHNDGESKGKHSDHASWAAENFSHVPVPAAITILEKIKNDIKGTESAIIEKLFSQIGALDVKIDRFGAQVVAPKSYLPAGKEYTADIFLSASSSQVQSTIYIGQVDRSKFNVDTAGTDGKLDNSTPFQTKEADGKPAEIPMVGDFETIEASGGVGKFEIPSVSGVGEKKYEGVVSIKTPEGYDFYPFQADYEVAPPSGFAVMAEKMNVMYIGVDNPLRITVAGSKDSDVRASISGGGTVTSTGGGKFNARVTTPGEVSVNVTGIIDGESKSIGSAVFRVKRIPDPTATLGGVLEGGKIQPGTLKAQSGLVAKLDNFDFEARFDVVDFEMALSSGGELFRAKGTGPLLTGGMKDLLSRAKAKDVVFFDNIRVKGPDGTVRKLKNSMVFEVI